MGLGQSGEGAVGRVPEAPEAAGEAVPTGLSAMVAEERVAAIS